jgi:hypothetical protein
MKKRSTNRIVATLAVDGELAERMDSTDAYATHRLTQQIAQELVESLPVSVNRTPRHTKLTPVLQTNILYSRPEIVCDLEYRMEAYVFTPEQLDEHNREVIRRYMMLMRYNEIINRKYNGELFH